MAAAGEGVAAEWGAGFEWDEDAVFAFLLASFLNRPAGELAAFAPAPASALDFDLRGSPPAVATVAASLERTVGAGVGDEDDDALGGVWPPSWAGPAVGGMGLALLGAGPLSWTRRRCFGPFWTLHARLSISQQ